MDYLYRVLIWFIPSALWGVAGVAFGPGIAMLFIGAIVGCSGCLYSLCEKFFGFQLKLFWSALIVSLVSLVFAALVFKGLSLQAAGYFLAVLFIPSYLINFLIKKLRL